MELLVYAKFPHILKDKKVARYRLES
jgi:hypothetical protein